MRRRRRSNPVVRTESLELRQLLSGVTSNLSGGVLTVTGTVEGDAFSVREEGPVMRVQCAGAAESFDLASISSVVILGGAGDDQIRYESTLPATVQGEAGDDTIVGGAGDDSILGGSGNDNIRGGGGSDTIIGGLGRDKLTGGGGHDELYGANVGGAADSEVDELRGGSGQDLLTLSGGSGGKAWAGNGRDTVHGGFGDDTIFAQGGDDLVIGNDGNDFIEGNNGRDELRGNAGADTLRGFDGDDMLIGGSGQDSLSGGAGFDVADGGDGADVVAGGSERDVLVGGRGKDTITGGGDSDVLIGGEQASLRTTGPDIRREWSSARDYLVRRLNVIDGSGGGGENEGSFVTTNDDGAADVLNGVDGNDLFFANSATDRIDVVNGESVEQQGECSLNANEQGIADLTLGHANQAHPELVCDLTLSQVARAKALDMATRGYFTHTDPDGIGPNKLVRDAGFLLPSFYGSADSANNVESIVAGFANFQDAFDTWMASEAHRQHLLGETSFYEEQSAFGVGYAFDASSPFQHYYVFIAAKPV